MPLPWVNAMGFFQTPAGAQVEQDFGDIPQKNTHQRTCVEFDGSADFMADTADATVGIVDDWTVSLWFRTDSLTVDQRILTIENSANQNSAIQFSFLGVTANDPFEVRIFDTAGALNKQYQFTATLGFGVTQTDKWYHLAASWDGTEERLRMYMNGSELLPTTLVNDDTITMADDARRIVIGADAATSGSFLDGRVHNVAIWSSQLHSRELREVYNWGRAGRKDLNEDASPYLSSDDLQHWYRPGHDTVTIGRDFTDAASATLRELDDGNEAQADIRLDEPAGSYAEISGALSWASTINAPLNVLGDVFTVAGWWRPDTGSMAAARTLFRWWEGSLVNSFDFNSRGDLANDPIEIIIEDNSGTVLQSLQWENAVDASHEGQWVHVAFSWDGTVGGSTLYVNGVDQGDPTTITTDLAATTFMDDNRDLWWGSGAGSGDIDGSMLDFGIWDVELSAASIQEMVKDGVPALIDLMVNEGNYQGSSSLKHWFRAGYPNLGHGQDQGTTSANWIDIQRDVVNLLNADHLFVDGTWHFDLATNERWENSLDNIIGIADAWSASGWARVNGVATFYPLIYLDPLASDNSRIDISFRGNIANDPIKVEMYDSAGVLFKDIEFTSGVASATWFNWAVTYDGTTVRCYIDGTEITGGGINAITDNAGIQADDGRRTFVGISNTGGNIFDGEYHGVALWNTELDAANVGAIAASGNQQAGTLFDLRADSGAYDESAALAHWWPVGLDAGGRAENTRPTYDIQDACIDARDLTNAGDGVIDDPEIRTEDDAPNGFSMAFDGVSEYLATSSLTNTLGIANAFTLAGWVMPDSDTTNQTIADIRPATGDINRINIELRGADNAGRVRVELYDSAGVLFKQYLFDGLLSTGAWQYLAVSWDGATLALHLDGALTAASSTPTDNAGTMTATNRRFFLGADSDAFTQTFDGKVSFWALWSSALSTVTTFFLYTRRGSPELRTNQLQYASSTTLQAWWPIADGFTAGNFANDLTTNARHLDTITDAGADARRGDTP